MDELRLALRRLRRRPVPAIVSVLTLGCAIGAAAATWSLLSSVLLHPLPVTDPDRVVVAGQLTTMGPRAGMVYDGLTYPYLQAFRESGTFAQVAAEWNPAMSLLTSASAGQLPVRDAIGFVTFDLFDLLGVRVPLGRAFTAADDRRGVAPVAILTDDFWRRTFDGSRDVIGRTITIAGKAVTVIGVTPPGFRGLDLSTPVDAYLPFHTLADIGSPFLNYFAEATHQSSPSAGTRIIGRLRIGAIAAEDAARLSGMSVAVAGRTFPNERIVLTPINEAAIPMAARGGMNQFARLLGTTVALLLLIGCGTVGMLLLIRTEARREELAMCVALGASRARLARGIVLEGALLSGAGALLAIPVAWWLFKGLATFELPGGVHIGSLNLTIDSRALAAAGASALVACMLISVIAATFGLASSAADGLRSRGGATPRASRRRTRAALVTAQVAVALILVAGATLFARSLAAALSLNAGLDMNTVVTGYVDLGPYGYNVARATAFFDDLRSRLDGNGAITSVAYGLDRGGMLGKLEVDGAARAFPTQVGFFAADERYFRTLGVRLSGGRDFTRTDRPGAPLVAIVSASLARELGAGGSAIGKRVTMPFHKIGKPADVMEVVGVVDDVVTRVSELRPLTMYFPMAQTTPDLSRTLAVRAASGQGDAAQREMTSAIKAIDPAVSPLAVFTLEERIARQMGAQRFGALVLGALGTIALLLTVLGTYVLGESMAAIRMREMGIRAALGATRRQLGGIVVAETGRLVGLGLAVGLGGAWLGAGTIRGFLFQVPPLDPMTLAGVAGVILTLALLVSVRPALRAARVDLASVLREQ